MFRKGRGIGTLRALLLLLLTSAFIISVSGALQATDAIPPTQGAQGGYQTASISELKILGRSFGMSMVTYKASALVSPGISVIEGIRTDEGMADGSLRIRLIEGDCTVEDITIKHSENGPESASLQVLSIAGGSVAFEVDYLTSSISWEVTGTLATSPSMTVNGEIYLSVRNSSSFDFLDAELLLFGQGGNIISRNGLISGNELWSTLIPSPQSVDVPANSRMLLPLTSLNRITYKTYVSGVIGSALKGYTGKSAIKEQIKLDILLEADISGIVANIPVKPSKLTLYSDGAAGIVPINWLNEQSISLVKGILTLKLDSASMVIAEIEKTESKAVGSSSFEEAFRLILKSSSSYPTEVQLIESFPGEWELISNTGSEWQRIEGNSAIIRVTIPAKGTVTQMYKVRYTYSR